MFFSRLGRLLTRAASDSSSTVAAAAAAGGIPSKVTLNIFCPHETILAAQKADMVIIPAINGLFGVTPGHVPTIAELKPGVVSVHEESAVTNFFVSGGFAFVRSDSTCDISAVEAVPVDQIDVEAVRSRLTKAREQFDSATDEQVKATAQIGVEVLQAMEEAVRL